MQGIICFILLAFQIYFKVQSETIIYIFNPCHAVTFLFGVISLMPFNRLTDALFPVALASCFGAWIGIVFAENGELSDLEIAMYYIQHVFAAFLAPLVLFLEGRYSATDQLRWPLPLYGFMGFTLYMRYFLTPMSAITWANLNHTLCAGDNDPWSAYFGMHKYFYVWADGYLALTSVASQYFISILGMTLCRCRTFTIHSDKKEMKQIMTGIAIIAGLGSFASYVLSVLAERAALHH